jgi:type III pantothenate kinase
MTDREPILVFDAGNTRIKAAIFGEAGLIHEFQIGTDDYATVSLDRILTDEVARRPSGVILGSVVRGVADAFAPVVKRLWGLDMLIVSPDMPIGVRVDVPNPETVGIDRLLISGEAYAETTTSTVVVGVGTAITVDVVTRDGVYLGGTISPGLRTSTWALSKRTSLLPDVDVDVDDDEGGVPKSTPSSIRTGVILGTAGAVDRLISELAERAGLVDYKVILTGGDSHRLSRFLDTNHDIRDDLLLKGLASTYHRLLE